LSPAPPSSLAPIKSRMETFLVLANPSPPGKMAVKIKMEKIRNTENKYTDRK